MALSKLAAFRTRYKTVRTEESQENKKSALRPLPNRSLVSHDLSSLGSTKPECREVPRGSSQGVGYVRVN